MKRILLIATLSMGGMFTILKVREHLKDYKDPGWYEQPKGTLASPATSEERRDGIKIPA